LRKVNLKVNPKKCILFSQKVKYTSNVISSERISTDDDKITAVNNWSIPQNKKHLQSFLRLCSYYRKFVKGFSILKPLYTLTKNQTKSIWNEQCEDTFNRLKRALTSSPILSLPREEEKLNFILFLRQDRSNSEIRGVDTDAVENSVLGSFPLTVSGNKHLLVIDCFIKWVEAFLLKNVRARTVAETFLNQVVSRLEFL